MSILDPDSETIYGDPVEKKKVIVPHAERIRCESRDANGNQCGFEKGHELKPFDPDNVNHPRHGWAGRTPMIKSWT